MRYGWGLYGDSETLGTIKIKKNMELNTVINTEKGALLFTYFRRNAEKYEEKALGNVDDNKNEENPPKVKKYLPHWYMIYIFTWEKTKQKQQLST